MLKVLFSRMSMFMFGGPTPLDKEAGMERRRTHRLYTDLPVEYRINLQDQASLGYGQATMKNISQGGAYLECHAKPGIAKGQVGHFTFRSLAASEGSESIHLAAKGIVRRLEDSNSGERNFGLALEFLSGPLIFFNG